MILFVWLTDITYIPVDNSFSYLVAMVRDVTLGTWRPGPNGTTTNVAHLANYQWNVSATANSFNLVLNAMWARTQDSN